MFGPSEEIARCAAPGHEPSGGEDLLRMNAPANGAHWLARLSPAQQQVARQVCAGLDNKGIAAVLGKSVHTVKHQLSCILSEVGVPTRCRLIVRYYQQVSVLLPADGNRAAEPPRAQGQTVARGGQFMAEARRSA